MKLAEFLSSIMHDKPLALAAMLAKVGALKPSWMDSETALRKHAAHRTVRNAMAKTSRRRNRRRCA